MSKNTYNYFLLFLIFDFTCILILGDNMNNDNNNQNNNPNEGLSFTDLYGVTSTDTQPAQPVQPQQPVQPMNQNENK